MNRTEGSTDWAVYSPDVRKVAHQLTAFTYKGSYVFFYVPEGALVEGRP